MSGLIDTNILVYAVNRDSPLYSKANAFLTRMGSGGPLYLCWAVVYEFLRVTTHPKIFSRPLSWKEAWDFISALAFLPQTTLLLEAQEHGETLEELLKSLRNPHGNFFHDCHIATLLKENGVRVIYTRDTDFRQFSFLEVIDPLV